MDKRTALLEKIIRFKKPAELHDIQTALADLGESSDDFLTHLSRDMIVSVLERYLKSELTAQNVEDWANAIEMHEDILLGQDDEEEDVFMAISRLANPHSEGPLTQESARDLIRTLASS